MRAIAIAGLLASVLAIPAPGFAHSFQLGVVVPLSGSAIASGQQALDGLRLATRERDGHPDESSDGHLGGLDSHLRPIDSARVAEPGWLRRQVTEMRLDIITAAVPSAGLAAALEGTPAAYCPPGAGPVSAEHLDSAASAAFAAAFRTAFGYEPSAAAARGYNAGRAVDAAVRALGDVSDKAALTLLCAGEN